MASASSRFHHGTRITTDWTIRESVRRARVSRNQFLSNRCGGAAQLGKWAESATTDLHGWTRIEIKMTQDTQHAESNSNSPDLPKRKPPRANAPGRVGGKRVRD